MVALFGKLLDGRTFTAASIAKELKLGHAAGARRLKLLEKLPGMTIGAGKEASITFPHLVARPPVGGNAVAGVCLVSGLATALHETAMSEPVARLREEWVGRSKRAYSTDDLDRKFWFVVRGGEKALPKGATRLGEIIEAILDARELSVDYVHFDGRRENAIRVQPLTLAVHEHQFYVVAGRIGQRPHPFRFARMTNVKPGKKFTYPSAGEYSPRQVFQNVFGIFIGQPDKPIDLVKLRFAPKWRSYIESHRWHDTQIEGRPHADGWIDIEMQVRLCHELRAWILGFGADVEVLAPAALRREVGEALENGAARYRDRSAPPRSVRLAKTVPAKPKRRAGL